MADNWLLKAVLSANASPMISQLKGVNAAAKATRKYLLDVGNSAGNLAGKLGLPMGILSGVAGGFSINAIKNAMVGLADMEDEVSKFSATTGIAGAEYKKFQYLAKLSNVPFEALTGSMGKLNKSLYDAATGKNKDLGGLMKHLGIRMRDANGELRSAADLLPELADAFQRNENPVVRARMGMALFGKSWQEIMPLLADGSERINQRLARFRELGLEVKDGKIFDKQMEAAGRFGDRLDDLSFVAKGFQNTIAAGLLPVVEPLINDLIKWSVANKELIATEVKAFVKDLADGLRSIDWKGVVQGAKDFVGWMKGAVDSVGGGRNALILLVAFMNIQTIAAFAGLIGAAGRLTFKLGELALKALAPISPLQTMTDGMDKAHTKAANLTNTIGRLGSALGVIGAGMFGWEVGTLLNDNVINPLVQKLSGDKDASLGTWLYDMMNPDPLAQKPSLVSAGQNKVSGEVKVTFENAPPGMRVEQAKSSGPVAFNPNVGYRTLGSAGAF